jgi:hypothetical protein
MDSCTPNEFRVLGFRVLSLSLNKMMRVFTPNPSFTSQGFFIPNPLQVVVRVMFFIHLCFCFVFYNEEETLLRLFRLLLTYGYFLT